MKFEYSDLLWVSLICSGLTAIFLIYNWKVRRRLMRAFVLNRDLEIGVSPWLQKTRLFLLFLGFTLAFLSLARPQWGRSEQEYVEKGIDVIVAIDTSRSLLAEDLPPNRFERIRLAVKDLISRSAGNRFGLVVFAGSAFLQTPLTSDPGALMQTLDAIDVGIISEPGSDFSTALEECAKAFDQDDNRYKAVVFFSDGEDHGLNTTSTAKAMASQNIKVFTVGAGTAEGELIPVRLPNNQADFHRDRQGNVVKTRLDEKSLTSIAELTDGFYVNLQDISAMDRVLEEGIESLPKSDLSVKKFSQLNEQYQWPLSIAVVLLVLEFLIPEHRLPRGNQRQGKPGRRSAAARTALSALFISIWTATATNASTPAKAAEAYNNGLYEKARSYYADLHAKYPEDPRVTYNLASAEYQLQNLDEASALFEELLKVDDLNLQQKAYYGLGNSEFIRGRDTETPEEKLRHWKKSLEMLKAAAKLNPDDSNAVSNRDYVQKQIEDLQQQQDQQQQEDDQQKQNQDQQDQEKEDNQEGQSEDGNDNGQEQKDQEQEQEQNPDSGQQDEGQQDQEQQQQSGDQQNSSDENGDSGEEQSGAENSEQQENQQNRNQNQNQNQNQEQSDSESNPENGESGEQDREDQPQRDPSEDGREQRDAREADGADSREAPSGEAMQPIEGSMSPEQVENFLKSHDQKSRFLLMQPTNKVSRSTNRYSKDW